MTARPQDPHIGLVVEGPGDKEGVPILLRAHRALAGDFRELFGKPIPCKGRGSATVDGGIEGFVSTAAARPGCHGVLVVLDSDKDPICELGPDLLARVIEVSKVPTVICLAEKSFEHWIYSSAETLDLGLTFNSRTSPLVALKSGLSPIKYTKAVWQPKLASRMDTVLAASRSISLARTLAKVDELVGLISD